MWILKLVTSLWAVTSSLSYYIIDPAASAALVQSGCRLPSFGCLRLAQEAHIKLVKGQIEKYWCQVAEDMAQREREKKAKEDHDTYIAGQIAKGDKWDRWEVSPPTVNVFNNYNYINPTFNFNTIISTCPATPDIPGVDVAALVKKHQPTIGDELVIDKYAVYKEAGMVWLGHVLDTFLFSVLIYIVCSIVVKLIKFIFRFLFM